MLPKETVALAVMKCAELSRPSPSDHEFALSISCSTGTHFETHDLIRRGNHQAEHASGAGTVLQMADPCFKVLLTHLALLKQSMGETEVA